jgi:hypothetical protein
MYLFVTLSGKRSIIKNKTPDFKALVWKSTNRYRIFVHDLISLYNIHFSIPPFSICLDLDSLLILRFHNPNEPTPKLIVWFRLKKDDQHFFLSKSVSWEVEIDKKLQNLQIFCFFPWNPPFLCEEKFENCSFFQKKFLRKLKKGISKVPSLCGI